MISTAAFLTTPKRSSFAATSRTCVFSFPHGERYRTLNWPDLQEHRNDELPSYQPLAIVTARLLARRWLFYVFVCALVFALQAIFIATVHVKAADFYAQLIGSPLVILVVTVFAGSDATSTLSIAQRWERILERGWALIVIDVGLTFVQLSGFQALMSGAADAGNVIMGFLTLLLSAMLVYAEPFIALEKDAQPLTLLPFAILRSMMLGWVNVSRIFSLFAVQIVVIIGGMLVHESALKAGAGTALWVDIAYGTLTTVPLAALYAVAYLDTLSQEKRTLQS